MNLKNYKTGEVIREATEDEIKASRSEIKAGHYEGVIEVEIEGKYLACFVEE